MAVPRRLFIGGSLATAASYLAGLERAAAARKRKRVLARAGVAQGVGAVGITVARTRLLEAGGQEAVALTPADGEIISGSTQSNFTGNGFWERLGMTRAAAWTGPNPLGGDFTGFDDPNFIPICTWLADFSGTGFYTRMDDLGLNGMWVCAGSVSLDNNVTFEKWAGVESVTHAAGTITGTQDPCVVGVVGADEPSSIVSYESAVDTVNDWLADVSDGPGRMSLLNYADNLLNGDIEGTYDTTDMVLGRDATHTTPPFQWTGCDQYWFAGAPDDSGGSQTKLFFRLYQALFTGTPGTQAQTARGSHYGSMMDCIRKAYPVDDVRPFAVWVENGAPYDLASSAAITPAQMKWAVWSTIVHGARQITYFNHTFRTGDPLQTHNNFNDNGYGGPGVPGTGIYAAAKEIHLLVLELAPVINSPFDGYLCWGDGSADFTHTGFLTACTSTNTRNYFAGVDASCKWQPTEGKHYILASTREVDGSTNWPVTYRMVDQGQTVAVDLVTDTPISIERGGGIPGGFCEFDDTFATAASYKAYRID